MLRTSETKAEGELKSVGLSVCQFFVLFLRLSSQRSDKQVNNTLKKLARAQDSLEQKTLSKTDLEKKLKTAIEDSEQCQTTVG